MQPNRIIIFSMHRSGSTVLSGLGRRLSGKLGFPHFGPKSEVMRSGEREHPDQPERWMAQPGCYGPIRQYIPVPNIDESGILLQLRDPRDVLVSMFYAYCYSHKGELAPMTGIRRETAARGIDDFVLRMAASVENPYPGRHGYGTGANLWDRVGNVRRRYDAYLSNLYGRPNVTFVRYEDMVTDPAAWFGTLKGVFGIEEPEKFANLEASLASRFTPRSEDKWKHKRQIQPGDHKAKLEPETIGRLNDIFADVLTELGYEI